MCVCVCGGVVGGGWWVLLFLWKLAQWTFWVQGSKYTPTLWLHFQLRGPKLALHHHNVKKYLTCGKSTKPVSPEKVPTKNVDGSFFYWDVCVVNKGFKSVACGTSKAHLDCKDDSYIFLLVNLACSDLIKYIKVKVLYS